MLEPMHMRTKGSLLASVYLRTGVTISSQRKWLVGTVMMHQSSMPGSELRTFVRFNLRAWCYQCTISEMGKLSLREGKHLK